MSSRYLICGNWKMNKTRAETWQFFADFLPRLQQVQANHVETMFAVPYTLLDAALSYAGKAKVGVAAQNIHEKLSGAFTGEISATMLKDIGISSTLIGHSERRQYYNETDAKVGEKVALCIEQQIMPIVCVGETLEQRDQGQTFAVVQRQMTALLAPITKPANLVIAYEPVWAIGTGKTASKEQAQEVHAFIRSCLTSKFNGSDANDIKILYGGSVTPANALDLLSQEDIDGALVGGASLKPTDFVQIIDAAAKS